MKWLMGCFVAGSVVVSSAAIAAHVGSLTVGTQQVTVGAGKTKLLYLDVQGVGEPGTSLDIRTDNLGLDGEVDTGDTELGLYDPNGVLVANDDDGGAAPGAFLASLLSFSDGDSLQPGRYTVVLGSFDTVFPSTDPTPRRPMGLVSPPT